ncbi:hypothetical protein [Thauera sinica]|uniref:Uncharacterized protein n=1 Tax=Thauera sinica TaxID=2665146 RepID=A0ABW1AVF7_9RHOO|nr:hypothetical protein [Thauera sp. K11]
MHEPYLELYIEDETLHFAKKLPTEEASRGIIEVPIKQITSDTFDEAARKVGGTVLGLFKLWHKKDFGSWDDSNALENGSIEDFSVALYLIDKLSQGCSEDRLRLIDEILSEAAISNVVADDYLRDDWPFLRKRLLRT